LATTFKPGQTITISYTNKGYAVTVAGNKLALAKSKVKYYSDLELLLSDASLVITADDAALLDTSVKSLSASKTKKKAQGLTAGYYDSLRPYSEDTLYNAELPGYQNAYFEFININTGDIKVIGFMISPNSVGHSYSTSQQINKTMAGWYIMRTGKNIQQTNLTGYMLDTRYCQERHDFLENYKEYIEDSKNASNEYTNEWSVSLIIEGRKYIGFVQSLGIQKSSIQPFLYQYNITYASVNDFLIYRSAHALENKRTMTPPAYSVAENNSEITNTLGNTTGELLGLV
jgi:hypothetical protein